MDLLLPPLHYGLLDNQMEYARWGSGEKSLLFLPGGPGNSLPCEFGIKSTMGFLRPVLDDYTAWFVARRRGMPKGYTVADMADDYADAIALLNPNGGKADLVVGQSYGGMIAQHLAAAHPDRFEHLVVLIAGCEVSVLGKNADYSFAMDMSEGKRLKAGAALSQSLFPSVQPGILRKFLGVLFVWLFLSAHNPHASFSNDVLVEAEAEMVFDARSVLPNVTKAVLIIGGDQDVYFPLETLQETAQLIPDCTMKVYEGKGHVTTALDGRILPDILEFIETQKMKVSDNA